MNWIAVTISAYFILAVVFLVDKYLLVSSVPNSKVYAFYVGLLGSVILLVIPFVDFYIPDTPQLILALTSGAVFVYGLSWLYKTLKLFEVSRVIPAVGGLTPIFTFLLIYIISSGKEVFSFFGIIAFVFLISGSVIINLRKDQSITFTSFKFSVVSAFLLSLSFVLTKYVYMAQPFWNGFIWKTLGGVTMAIIFYLIFSEVRENAFRKEKRMSGKTAIIFLLNQTGGAGASILQNWAIFLAPLVYIPIVYALNGTQYVFLFLFTIILSLKFPKIIKEEISKEAISQKVIAILLIGAGLFFLYFK
ncbi:MAG: hypothetical protein ABIA08_00590 [bacterium]